MAIRMVFRRPLPLHHVVKFSEWRWELKVLLNVENNVPFVSICFQYVSKLDARRLADVYPPTLALLVEETGVHSLPSLISTMTRLSSLISSQTRHGAYTKQCFLDIRIQLSPEELLHRSTPITKAEM